MSDILDGDGLQIKSLSDLREELEEAFREIYGEDINIEPNTPDGQIINIFAQEGVDLRELLEQINSGFDPDQAEGRTLDQRVAINGIERRGGTYTQTPVDVTADRSVSLTGLDDEAETLEPDVSGLFTVRDDAGNQFFLLESTTINDETLSLTFRAEDIGEVTVSPNTITTVVTTTPGITEVNNPEGASVLGEDEETDAALRRRRRRSVAITSTGYVQSIEAALGNVDGVTTAIVRENDTNEEDADGTGPHSIWAIVEGGSSEDIGGVIYAKKPPGTGQRGEEEVEIDRPNGTQFVARFDRPINQDLWISFNVVLPDGGNIDTDFIASEIVENIIWGVGANAVGSVITEFVQGLNERYQITAMQVSDDDSTFLEVVSPESPQHRFINSTDRIDITT